MNGDANGEAEDDVDKAGGGVVELDDANIYCVNANDCCCPPPSLPALCSASYFVDSLLSLIF